MELKELQRLIKDPFEEIVSKVTNDRLPEKCRHIDGSIFGRCLNESRQNEQNEKKVSIAGLHLKCAIDQRNRDGRRARWPQYRIENQTDQKRRNRFQHSNNGHQRNRRGQ